MLGFENKKYLELTNNVKLARDIGKECKITGTDDVYCFDFLTRYYLADYGRPVYKNETYKIVGSLLNQDGSKQAYICYGRLGSTHTQAINNPTDAEIYFMVSPDRVILQGG